MHSLVFVRHCQHIALSLHWSRLCPNLWIGKLLYMRFLDLPKAFDLVSYDKLWEKLGGASSLAELIKIFSFWYKHQKKYIKWGNVYSDAYTMLWGEAGRVVISNTFQFVCRSADRRTQQLSCRVMSKRWFLCDNAQKVSLTNKPRFRGSSNGILLAIAEKPESTVLGRLIRVTVPSWCGVTSYCIFYYLLLCIACDFFVTNLCTSNIIRT